MNEERKGFWRWYFKQDKSVPIELIFLGGGSLIVIIDILMREQFSFLALVVIMGGGFTLFRKYKEWWKEIGHKL